MNKLDRYAPYALAALRIIAALLFFEHGLMKLVGFPAPQPGGPLTPLSTAAGIIEIAGGTLIALGLFTRPAAFICSGMMAVGYFVAHAPQGFWPALNMGDAAILFCFVFFYLTFAGPGAFSVDGAMRGRKA